MHASSFNLSGKLKKKKQFKKEERNEPLVPHLFIYVFGYVYNTLSVTNIHIQLHVYSVITLFPKFQKFPKKRSLFESSFKVFLVRLNLIWSSTAKLHPDRYKIAHPAKPLSAQTYIDLKFPGSTVLEQSCRRETRPLQPHKYSNIGQQEQGGDLSQRLATIASAPINPGWRHFPTSFPIHPHLHTHTHTQNKWLGMES